MRRLEDMPDEVIVNIFSYLPLIDRKNTRLVCKHWHNLSYSMSLIKDDISSANNYLFLDKMISPNVRHVNVRTKIVDDKKFVSLDKLRAIEFWSKFGQDLKSVEIFCIDVYHQVLIDVFKHCTNLQYLSLSYWDENDTPRPACDVQDYTLPYDSVNLPKLLSLDLMHMSQLDATALKALTDNALKLKRISLEWWRPSVKDPRVLDVLLQVVTRQCTQLKEINLSHSLVTDEFITAIAKVLGPQLTGFYIQWCEELTDTPLTMVAKNLTNLKEIDLGRCNFTENGLVHLFTSLNNLTHICLKKTKHLTDASVASLRTLSNLMGLDLTECPGITDEGVGQVFGFECRPKMIDLRLSKVKKITDDVICSIASNLPNLKFLYLNGCHKLTNRSLEAIFFYNRLLRCFSIQDCVRIRDLNVGATVNALKGLIHLDLFGCRNISSKSVSTLRLIELQTADLSDVAVSVEDVSAVLMGCPSLQYLYLDYQIQEIDDLIKRRNNVPVFRWGFSRFEPDSLFD